MVSFHGKCTLPNANTYACRMNPETLTILAQFLYDKAEGVNGRPPTDFTKQVAMTVAYLGSKEITYRMAHQFGLSEAVFLEITYKIIKKLINKIDYFISFPNYQDFAEIADEFNPPGKCTLPFVLGVVDGCHLMIEPIKDEFFSCYNYKHYHSISLMGIAGPKR